MSLPWFIIMLDTPCYRGDYMVMHKDTLRFMNSHDAHTLYRKLNEGMLEERLRAFQINLKKNLPYIQKYGGIAPVVASLRGKNICVLGAGPSLERTIGTLRNYQHRRELAIIAVDMALIPLLLRGIVPAYVISCETTPLNYFDAPESVRIHLLAFSCMASINVRRWQGPISFFNWMIGGVPYDELWENAGRGLGSIATGNIVTTQALSLALGCAPESVFIAGNDLAFDRVYYTPGTVVYRARMRTSNRFFPMESADWETMRKCRDYELHREGRRYYTSHQFYAAKTWLEELLSKTKVPVFDSSEPGISGKYAAKVSPEAYFSRFERRSQRRKK